MQKILIVNADDCNLTAGVTRAILKCHDQGILSSTTFMANLPVRKAEIRELLKRRGLGIGIHLNVTLGKPVLAASRIPSLLAQDGKFRRRDSMLGKPPAFKELAAEYTAQIALFRNLFGRLPTHLDTHHQLHDHPVFFRALGFAARRFGLPVRRSALMKGVPRRQRCGGLVVTDRLWGDLNPGGFWKPLALEKTLRHLGPGVHEIMCHPGNLDRDLRALSSFTHGRDRERDLFARSSLRKQLSGLGIRLSHYGMWYTWQK